VGPVIDRAIPNAPYVAIPGCRSVNGRDVARDDPWTRRMAAMSRSVATVSDAGTRSDELKGPGDEIFIGALSVFSMVNLVLVYAIRDVNLRTVVEWINVLLSHVPDRLHLSAVVGTVEVGVLFRRYGWPICLRACRSSR
jgi:hypothetical protein